jgi:hypothetical protein
MSIEKFMYKGMLWGMLAQIEEDENNPHAEKIKKGFLEACKEIGAMAEIELCHCTSCSAPEIKIEEEIDKGAIDFLKKLGLIKEDLK